MRHGDDDVVTVVLGTVSDAPRTQNSAGEVGTPTEALLQQLSRATIGVHLVEEP